MKNKKNNYYYLVILFVIAVLCLMIYFAVEFGGEVSNDTKNIFIAQNNLQFESMTTKQKLAQMIIVRGDKKDLGFLDLNVGGIFLDRQKNQKDYEELIKEYKKYSKVNLLIATDLEGAWTPFHEQVPNQQFPYFSEINSSEEAYNVGLWHGELLEEVGFNLNFAPVAEYSDIAYGGRTFNGEKAEVKEKIASYIEGLQKNIDGTCKHFPGKSMETNLHKNTTSVEITKEDLELFKTCYESDIHAMMVSHQITSGEIDSRGIPASVSENVISSIDEKYLVVADEVNMNGLSSYYESKEELYVDLINSGEEVILDFELSSKDLNTLLDKLVLKVNAGKIDTLKVDSAVKEILEFKGYRVL